MRKRLIFVDDEPLVLDGLRRALRGMREEWDMDFAPSAEAAMASLKQQPYDAIITDMRMPVMDGAQLLEEVKDLYPGIVRIVLSGQSSKEAVLRSIVPAHQFLSKPCELAELKSRLDQAFMMRDLLSSQALKTIVSRLPSLPSLPTLYNQLTDELRKDHVSLMRLGQIISRDVGMAAKVLQLANSAFIGSLSRVSNLPQAVSLIGTDVVRTLVLSVHVFSQVERNSDAAVYLPALWRHSVGVASLAQRIAKSQKASKTLAEDSFAAGLLHDVGKAILLTEVPARYRPVLAADETSPDSILRLEIKHLGCTHAEVGAYLLSIWGLPMPLVHAVAFHHTPSTMSEQDFSLLTAVHAAEAIESSADPNPLNRDAELDVAYLERLGLLDQEPAWRVFQQECAAALEEGKENERQDTVRG
jgi:HD-like signal output (HDOD) protein